MFRRSLLLFPVTAFALALVAPGCGDDDVVMPSDPVDATVDSAPPVDAGSPDAESDADAGDPQVAIEACTDCVVDQCVPALFSCLQDEGCRELALCVITSNCLSDLPSCVPTCLDASGGDPTEIIEQLLALQTLAEACTGCVETCRAAIPGGFDGGFPGGGFPGGGFPGFSVDDRSTTMSRVLVHELHLGDELQRRSR